MQIFLKNWLVKKDFKVLISNFISISLLQLLNYALPLIIIPFLIRVIGTEKFGMVSLAQATMNFLFVLTDYGFNLSATQAIATNKENPQKISEIFTSVFFAKILLLLLSFIILFLLITFNDKFKIESRLFLYSFTIVIGQTLFPLWYFQGIEKMKYIAIVISISKIIFTFFVFLFINQESDYLFVNLFMGIGLITGSVISLILTRNLISFRCSNLFKETFKRFIEGREIFLSSFAINLYISSNTIILGLFHNAIIVGYFAIAEKIFLGIRQLLSVIFQVTYPYICRLSKESHNILAFFQKKIIVALFISFLFLGTLTFIFAEDIILLVANKHISESVQILKILSFVPLIVALNIPAYQTLLSYDLKRNYMSILVTGSFICLVLNTIFAKNFAGTGTAISILITEAFVTFGLYFTLEYYHPKYTLLKFPKNESLS